MSDIQIEYFLAVAKSLNISKVAAERFVSQPAVSKQISSLEEELEVQLFKRGKKLELTRAGRMFEEFYRRQKEQLAILAEKAKGTRIQERKQELTIAFGSQWTLSHFLPVIFQKMQSDLTETNAACSNTSSGSMPNPLEFGIYIECYNNLHLDKMLSNQMADVAFMMGPFARSRPLIESRELIRIRRGIICAKNYPLSSNGPVRPEMFRDEPFFLFATHDADVTSEYSNVEMNPYGFIPKLRLVRDVDSVFVNVVNGLGVAIVEEWAYIAKQCDLQFIPLESECPIIVKWYRGNQNPVLRKFLDLLFALPRETLRIF
jgi:DNA-binding transcriptional LysR family regulator